MENNIDYIIDLREQLRLEKKFKECDFYRNLLETKNVFINDTKDGQEVWFLPIEYFKSKPDNLTNKEFWQQKVKQDKIADKNFSAWLYTMQQKIKNKNT
jgi:hypothetical protein